MAVHDIATHPIHLGLGGTASVEPEFTGSMDWYSAYEARHAQDGVEGRIVSMHSFSEPWAMWEMHPHGSEIVLCTSGRITLHQEQSDGTVSRLVIGPGQYAVNQAGIWHTADIEGQVTAVFITAGSGTQHRPR